MRNPNQHQLAMRDPALAALLGVLPAGGSDFGYEQRGYDRRPHWEREQHQLAAYDQNLWQNQQAYVPQAPATFAPGYEFGAGETVVPGAMTAPGGHPGHMGGHHLHPHHPMHPANQAQMLAIWNEHHTRRMHTDRREMLLEPNRGSATKIERYSFALNSDQFTLGGAFGQLLTGLSNRPTVTIRPQRMVTNAPVPGFAYVDNVLVSNVSATVGQSEDAFNFSALAVGVHLDLPTITPANPVSVTASYSGIIPPGYGATGQQYIFVTSFQGPAAIVG